MKAEKTNGARGCMAAWNACAPSVGLKRPSPPACKRECISRPAAIPTSAHGPHWTLEAESPCVRRAEPTASRQQLAAA
eukprot:scaffold330582_cov131-Tisochrysis_lutea.AAC.1